MKYGVYSVMDITQRKPMAIQIYRIAATTLLLKILKIMTTFPDKKC